jgi:hypothetical protein
MRQKIGIGLVSCLLVCGSAVGADAEERQRAAPRSAEETVRPWLAAWSWITQHWGDIAKETASAFSDPPREQPKTEGKEPTASTGLDPIPPAPPPVLEVGSGYDPNG